MGKCRSYRPRKRKFHGNQNTKNKEEIMTASSLKLQQCNQVNNDEINISKHLTGNRLIDLEILIGIFALLCCPTKKCTAGILYLVEDSRFGLSSNFTLHCKNCSFISAFCTSKKLDKMNELNPRFVYGLRLIGRGVSAGRKLCVVLNLPPFLSKLAFRQQEKKLLSAATSIGEKIMNDAAKELLSDLPNSLNSSKSTSSLSISGLKVFRADEDQLVKQIKTDSLFHEIDFPGESSGGARLPTCPW
ncbi:uncharacterized protein TNIN_456901 [Trichonephila inaurata madagascariensis]|uniref:Mutator-like transposase domain-containing protein n=1 Tax=Trichonephila inaurata madagascariensis TaxID=2747483 RepID=A0A8X6IJK1_9ARAC|nr:uncharacterized protein TNIN_456901 [Trichonephila inaurata madagascariensis]